MEYPVCSVANGRAFPQGRLLGQEDEAPKEQVQLLLEVMLPSHCPPCASVSPAGPEREDILCEVVWDVRMQRVLTASAIISQTTQRHLTGNMDFSMDLLSLLRDTSCRTASGAGVSFCGCCSLPQPGL